jgi:starch synthase
VPLKVLFATAEYAPIAKVGGLGDAAAGLVSALRELGAEVEVVLPDYEARIDKGQRLEVPGWAGPARFEAHRNPEAGTITLIGHQTLTRPHPYTDRSGKGWPDNDFRFMAFSAGIAALVEIRGPDILHINDWHTGATLGFVRQPPPSVLTMHNPAYQGTTVGSWLDVLVRRSEAYEWYGGTNPLTGAIALASSVVTVSPTFASELVEPGTDFGLSGPLKARGSDFCGILNGIDTNTWDPSHDRHLPKAYDITTSSRKREIGRQLSEETGLVAGDEPLIGMVTRLTEQKGVDLALDLVGHLESMGARMILLGSGDEALAGQARKLSRRSERRFVFVDAYDEGLAHRIFGGCDLFLVPSRFEPCGLTQMQAMRYGAIPVVTPVGGLRDTVIDADADPVNGTGFVAPTPDAASFRATVERALTAWRSTRRRGAIRRNGMSRDWSWSSPATDYLRLYQDLMSGR